MKKTLFKYKSRPASLNGARIERLVTNLSSDKMLESILRRRLLHALRMAIYTSHFRKPPVSLMRSARVFVKGNKISMQVLHPGSRFLDQGVRRHLMTYLRGAGAIPIKIVGGRPVFRSAPTSLLQSDQWVHPGFRGKDFMERADKEARKILKEEMAKVVAKKVLPILRGRK